MEQNLELNEIDMFSGTERYHKLTPFTKTVGTDGIAYIMNNGYAWFVTDVIIALETKGIVNNEPFLSIKLKVTKNKTATVTVDDGNGKIVYKQKYTYTDAKKDLTLFLADEVLMLSKEY